MPFVEKKRIKIENNGSLTKILFLAKINILQQVIFVYFIYISISSKMYFFLSFWVFLVILLSFKRKEIKIDRNLNHLVINHRIVFLTWKINEIKINKDIQLNVERYKPWGIIWESKNSYAYQLVIKAETKNISLCCDNDKNKLELFKGKITQQFM